jgi:hypothetical protein
MASLGQGFIKDEDDGRFFSKKEKKLNDFQKSKPNEYSRTYEASPIFPFANASLTAGSTQVFDIHSLTPTSEKYGTFTNLRVANNSSVNILVNPAQNTSRAILIPSGTIVELDRNALGGGFTSFSLTNASGVATANADEVKMEVYKQGITSDILIKQAHRNFFRMFGLGMNTGGR